MLRSTCIAGTEQMLGVRRAIRDAEMHAASGIPAAAHFPQGLNSLPLDDVAQGLQHGHLRGRFAAGARHLKPRNLRNAEGMRRYRARTIEYPSGSRQLVKPGNEGPANHRSQTV